MRLLKYGAVLLFLMSLWGCGSSGKSSTPPQIDPATGKHQVGWVAIDASGYPPHASAANGYFANPTGCVGCHGDNLTGGISKVSCFNNSAGCHNSIPFPHPAGYKAFAQHGADAKRNATTSRYYGMANCKRCHGNDYRGVAKSGVDCIACHRLTNPITNAPHAANWRGGNANNLQHSVISPAIDTNAAACNQCHARGNNSARKPNGPATTTYPDCFTDTLCHARDVGHSDVNWKTGAVHGANVKLQDLLATPPNASAKGFRNCAQCHANNALVPPRFGPTIATTGKTPCEKCHVQAGLAHPQTWVTGRGATAGVTNVASTHAKGVAPNYQVCTVCHVSIVANTIANGITYPSCVKGASIDGTARCHFTAPVDGTTFASVGCISCHYAAGVVPPGSNAHDTHLALTGVSCDACHFTAGNGGATHANGLLDTPPVNISPVYSAKTGSGTYSTGTCSNVSCHGGIPTFVAWNTVAIGPFDPTDPNSCKNCHTLGTAAGVPQYNSYYSGYYLGGIKALHAFHTDGSPNNVSCVDCHDTTKLDINHFTTLNTTAMEGPASATVGGGTAVVEFYNAATGECAANCHSTSGHYSAVSSSINYKWK